MSGGPNQHYIPSFVQRAFGIPPPRQVEIWRFRSGRAPERRRIKKTASEVHFYSEPSQALDDQITVTENRLSLALRDVRAMPPGTAVTPETGAEVVFHLATRTAHVRAAFVDGMSQMVDHMGSLLDDRGQLAKLLGIDRDAPGDLFHERLEDVLAGSPELARLKLPRRLIERLAFMFLKENEADLLEEARHPMHRLLRDMHAGLGGIVRDAHNRALGAAPPPDSYAPLLRSFRWAVENGPPAGAILPDCVVLGIDAAGIVATHPLTGRDGPCAVIMPLSPEKLLVGRKPGFNLPEKFDFNAEAASLSHSFFLSHRKDEETARLHPMIGRRLRPMLSTVTEESFEEALSVHAKEAGESEEEVEEPFSWRRSHPFSFTYYIGDVDEATMPLVKRQVTSWVNQVASVLPLERIDRIVLGVPTPAYSANRRAPADPLPPEHGFGMSRVLPVEESGAVKADITLSRVVVDAWGSDSPEQTKWATHVLIEGLAQVAAIGAIEESLPGCQLAPTGSEIDRWLYDIVAAVPRSYIAARIAAAAGDEQRIAKGLRHLLVDSLEYMRGTRHEAHQAFARDRDADRLVEIVASEVRHVLDVAATLLGHCDSSGIRPFKAGGALDEALKRAGLAAWFQLYGDHLRRLDQRLGRWTGFEEFLALNIHVERLLFCVGILVWEGHEGICVRPLPNPESGDIPLLR